MPTAARLAAAVMLAALLVGMRVSDAQGIVTVTVSDTFGAPGGTATVMIGVNDGNGDVLAVGLDLFFDAADLDIDIVDCTVAARLAATHTLAVFLPGEPPPPGQRRLRLALLDLSVPFTPFTDGAIATCTFSLAPGAGLGTTYPLSLDPTRLEVVDSQIPPMILESRGEDGSITVGEALATLCPATPRSGCRTAKRSLLVIQNKPKDKKDTLTWKWVKGAATNRDELAEPTATTTYGLCLYADDAFLMSLQVPPSAALWKPIKAKGFEYKDKGGTANGVIKGVLKAGKTGKAKAVVKGKGDALPDLDLVNVATPIRAQLFNTETGLCLEANYDASDIIKRSAKKLKAKAVH